MGEVVLVLGAQGTGKTFLAANLASEWPGQIIAFDPNGCMGTLAYSAGFISAEELRKDSWRPPKTRGPLLLLLDEVHMIAKKGRQAPRWLALICSRVRHYKMTVLATSQHPALCHPDIRALCTRILASEVKGASHLAWCRCGGLEYPKSAPPARSFIRLR